MARGGGRAANVEADDRRDDRCDDRRDDRCDDRRDDCRDDRQGDGTACVCMFTVSVMFRITQGDARKLLLSGKSECIVAPLFYSSLPYS